MPPVTEEDKARETIDNLLTAAGWQLFDAEKANILSGRGVAIREFPLPGHGFADYLLYVDGKAAGVIEAKKEGVTLSGVERQAEKYTLGLPEGLPRWASPLPFAYQSTGVETRFTNGLDPEPRSRPLFAFHGPEQLAAWLEDSAANTVGVKETLGDYRTRGKTFLERLQHMPLLAEEGLWPAQVTAIKNLEKSLAANKPRALIQMATGSGKTFTAISFIYRLIKFAGSRRVLFLVDRGNLGDQTLKEFQQYASPYNNFKFTEEYIVQRLTSNTLDTTARVCICTIQRMYSMLKDKDLPEDLEEESVDQLGDLFKQPEPIEYNPAIPIESFDIIVTDECHRSIYNLWAQVLEYFDAYLIGLTATPSRQTFGFFNQNLVMEYNHEMAVADGVNVNYDVYRIRTAITEQGSKVEAGYSVQIQERDTRKKRWEQLDDDFSYDPNQLDRDVVAPDQIRKIIQTFRDELFTEIFPGREWVPKTLIFAKDDAHAENIVEIVREDKSAGQPIWSHAVRPEGDGTRMCRRQFGKGNDFAQKITYRTTGAKPKDLINEFRTSPMPRIAVTVDMIATGTDIKAVEVVMFLRAVKSRAFFEQMKGRGVRVIKPDDVLSSLAGRLARMEHRLSAEDDRRVRALSGGFSVKDLSHRIVAALNPDRHLDQAKADLGIAPDDDAPVTDQAVNAARHKIILDAIKPLHDPELREAIDEIKKKNEVVIDIISADELLEAGFSQDALYRTKGIVQSFEQFIQEHKDEITALQVLYSKPYKQRLTFEAVKELADAIEKPPYLWNESQLWQAYAALEKSKVKGASGRRILTDLVSLVRFAIHQDNELIPFPERVNANFNAWLATQQSLPLPQGQGGGEGSRFTEEQMKWLEMIRDHIAANLGIEPDDFEYAPFAQEGGLGKLHQLFGAELTAIIAELNDTLAA